MERFVTSAKKVAKGNAAATTIEYALMIALIAVICMTAIALIGTKLNTKLGVVKTTVGGSPSGSGGEGGSGSQGGRGNGKGKS